jgi:hypothetical protein
MVRTGRAEDTHYACQGRIYAGSHVQRFNGDPGCIDPDQRSSSRSNMAHTCAEDAGHWTITVLDPRRTSTRIAESSDLGARVITGTNPAPLSIARALAGFSARWSAGAAAVRSASTTQRRSRLAFTPRDIAIAAIETPGCRHAATASDLNA